MKKVNNHPQIEALLDDNEQVLTLIYETLYPRVKAFIYHNKGSDKDAEDVFHNALFQLIVRAKTTGVVIKTSFEAYFLVVCKNLWYKEINKRKKEIRYDDAIKINQKTDYHVDCILQQERWDLFRDKFLKLSSNCQELLKDYFAKVSYDAIVHKFSYKTKNTAFQRIFKCKARLTQLVRNDVRFQKN